MCYILLIYRFTVYTLCYLSHIVMLCCIYIYIIYIYYMIYIYIYTYMYGIPPSSLQGRSDAQGRRHKPHGHPQVLGWAPGSRGWKIQGIKNDTLW